MEEKIALIVAIASLGVSLSGLPREIRLLTAVTGGGLAIHQGIELRSKRLRTESEQRNLAPIAEKLQADLDALALAEQQLNLEKAKQIQELKSLEESLLLDLQQKERQLEDRIELSSRESLRMLESQQQEQVGLYRKKIQELEEAIASLEDSKVKKQAEVEEWVRSRQAEILVREQELAGWKAEQEQLILKKKKELSIAAQKELEEAEDALLERFQSEQGKMLEELAAIKEQLSRESQQQFEQWCVPHIQEMDSKLREIEALRGTVEMLQQQIAEDRSIKLCPETGTVHGDRANTVLLYLRDQGVFCNFVSCSFAPDESFILNFLPWTVGPKSEKAIKGLLLDMQRYLGLSEIPGFQPNGAARSWSLVFYPSKRSLSLHDFYERIPQETKVGATFEDIEPLILHGISKEINYQEQVQEMMNFRPPLPLPMPRTRQISEIEFDSARWLFSWRSLATNGEQENITTRKGLLYHLYGKREGGSSSSYNPVLGESLGDRINRILENLRVEAVKLEGEEENV